MEIKEETMRYAQNNTIEEGMTELSDDDLDKVTGGVNTINRRQ